MMKRYTGVLAALAAGVLTRLRVVRRKGADHFNNVFVKKFDNLTVGGLLLIYPGVVTDAAGMLLVGAVILMQYMANKSGRLVAAGE